MLSFWFLGKNQKTCRKLNKIVNQSTETQVFWKVLFRIVALTVSRTETASALVVRWFVSAKFRIKFFQPSFFSILIKIFLVSS